MGTGDFKELFKELSMSRKSYDVFRGNEPIVISAKIVIDRLSENVDNRYKGTEERWNEMDKYWCGEDAAFLVNNRPYELYLPGRYYTYDTLTDIINNCLGGKGGKRAEIGCGSGIGLVIQAMKGADEVHGFDKSYGALIFFEDLAKYYKVGSKIRVKQGDFYSTGYQDSQFDATYNVGVVEHLDKEDRKKLVKEMARITRPGGVILVSIPNQSSPLALYTREKENTLFGKLKEYIFPLSKKEFYPINLNEIFEEADIKVEMESALLIAPPSEIPPKYLKDTLKQLYDKIPKMSRPKDVMELMKFWRMIEEKLATKEELNEIGWYKYIIGHKP